MDDSINGITIERYADMLALMNDFLDDKEKCIRVAEAAGINREDWKAAHKGWQEKMIDPADMGRTAGKFSNLWRAAVDKIRDSGNDNASHSGGSFNSKRSASSK